MKCIVIDKLIMIFSSIEKRYKKKHKNKQSLCTVTVITLHNSKNNNQKTFIIKTPFEA